MRTASLATAVILAFSANVYASYMDSIRARCEAYGSTPGTSDFYQCLHDVNVQEERFRTQRQLDLGLAGCTAPEPAWGDNGDATWESRPNVISQLSPVSLAGCSAQLR